VPKYFLAIFQQTSGSFNLIVSSTGTYRQST